MKKKKTARKSTVLWIVVFCVMIGLAGFYFERAFKSKLSTYISQASSVITKQHETRTSHTASPKLQTVSPAKGKFTFFPDGRDRYAWSVKYPDGRVFMLGEEFSGDCTPALSNQRKVAFEFTEQRSCNSDTRKSIQVDAESLKGANSDRSPEVIASISTGGNVYGHTASVISLTPAGPKVVKQLE